jgi:hypothetical protein
MFVAIVPESSSEPRKQYYCALFLDLICTQFQFKLGSSLLHYSPAVFDIDLLDPNQLQPS